MTTRPVPTPPEPQEPRQPSRDRLQDALTISKIGLTTLRAALILAHLLNLIHHLKQ